MWNGVDAIVLFTFRNEEGKICNFFRKHFEYDDGYNNYEILHYIAVLEVHELNILFYFRVKIM